MMTGGYDLSVAGMVGMAGCIAVIVGADAALLGIVAATLCGLGAGVFQALLVERLRVNSTSVALGGLLLFVGIAYVITDNQSVPYPNMSVALAVMHRWPVSSRCAASLPSGYFCRSLANRRHASRTRSDRNRKRSPSRAACGRWRRCSARRYLRFLGRHGCVERGTFELQSCLRFADWPIGRATSRHCRRNSRRRVAVRWYGSPDRNSHGCHDACGAARGSQRSRSITGGSRYPDWRDPPYCCAIRRRRHASPVRLAVSEIQIWQY